MMNELLTTTSLRPMEVAFWLLLSLGIAIFLWLCWRNIQRSRRERINKVLALVLTIAALATGQTAWAESVSYIDSYGSSVSVDATPLTGSDLTTDTELNGWYVVKANIFYKGRIILKGDVKIILCDGCTMNIGTSESPISSSECILGNANRSLSIYGQSNQTGALKAYNSSSDYNAVFIQQNYNQYGGNVTIDDSGDNALRINGTLYLNRGSLNVNCTSNSSSSDNVHAIWANGTFNYTGGKLTATSTNGKGINGAVSLSWSNYSESFKFQASSYGSTVTIATGKTFTDGTIVYSSGALTSEQINGIAGKTLTPIVTISGISYNSSLDAFEIASENNLKDLAVYVNGSGSYTTGGDETTAHTCEGLTFKVTGPIAFIHDTDWNDANSTENKYTPIGNSSSKPFSGTFDGQGYTISGIRIYSGNYKGLFGNLNGGTVKNVRLADARIAGTSNIGGIAGYNDCGTVMNCTVAADVCIHAVGTPQNHGGIVGNNHSGDNSKKAIVTACTSSAQLTKENSLGAVSRRGGIVGRNESLGGNYHAEVSGCLAIGVTIQSNGENSNELGAIVGYNYSSSSDSGKAGKLTNNYYSNCAIGNATTTATSGIGAGNSNGTGDVTTNDGARGIGTITLGTCVSMTGGTPVTVGSTTYYYAGSEITLSHSDREGYTFVDYSSSDVTISGSSFTMPAKDVTVNATWKKQITITADSDTKTYDGTPLTKNTYTLSTTLETGDVIESVTITGSQTNVGTSKNVPSAAVIKNSSNEDVTANYDITYVNGTLTVNPISIAAREAATNEYWTTYYNSIANLQVDVDTKVYKAAVNTATNKVDLTEITDRIINASKGVVLKSTHQNITATPVTGASADNYSGNQLQGEDAETDNPGNAYVLSKVNGTLGFYKLSSTKKLSAHKAYLTVSGGAPEFFGFDVDGETTKIETTDFTDYTDKAGAIYDLQGRKIANGQKPNAKGLYIVNGRKYIIK